MAIKRRTLIGGAAGVGAAVAGLALTGDSAVGQEPHASDYEQPGAQGIGVAYAKKRLTGVDRDTFIRWRIGGTDLGIPYRLENGSVGFLFGDTFRTRWDTEEPGNNDWRSPVMLRSNRHPGSPDGIVWDNAAGVDGDGRAPEITYNGHNGDDGAGTFEVTVIPNDAVVLPDGRHVMSYMSIAEWMHGNPSVNWRTNYAGLAISEDRNLFQRTPTVWRNDQSNTDPFQMWTMQQDGEYVYVFSVRAGRQHGPMMLRRVRPDAMFDPAAYEGWGHDGNNWDWGRPCTTILPEGRYGEPSVRRLDDGTWVMAYLNAANGCIVTRRADGRTGSGAGRRSRSPRHSNRRSTAGSSTRTPAPSRTTCT